MQTNVLEELYADDMDKDVSSETIMQRAMDQVSPACDNYDLSHNQHKKDRCCKPNRTMNEPTIIVDKQKKN